MNLKINNDVYEFTEDLKYTCCASDIFEAKKMVLSAIEKSINDEIQKRLIKLQKIESL